MAKTATDHGEGARWAVVVILAAGLASALNLITLAALWVAIHGQSNVSGGLSENATQVLTGAFGGIIGVCGSYVGYRAGQAAATADAARPTPQQPFTSGQTAP